jgi:hypothetical protein
LIIPTAGSTVIKRASGVLSGIFVQQDYRAAFLRNEPTLRRCGPYDRKCRRAQLSIRHADRNYDRCIAGLGTGKAQRYFASDFDRLSSCLFNADGAHCGRTVVGGGTAVLHAVSQYSNAVLDREKIDEGELHEADIIVSTV